MQKISFLGHDNASLSMLMESLYCLYDKKFVTEVVTIMDASQLDVLKIPFIIEGINNEVVKHDDWLPEADNIFVLGTMVAKIKLKIFTFFKENYALNHEQYEIIEHPSAIKSATSQLKNGCSLGPGSILAPFSKLGYQVSINRNVTVGHHTIIEDFATLNPSCNIAGFCKIGEGSTIGMGANVIDGKTIGKNSVVGAGSLVTKNIPDNVVAYGVPAKVIRVI